MANYWFCSLARSFQTLADLAEHLATAADLVFPVIHGQFGEDGGIQVLYIYKDFL